METTLGDNVCSKAKKKITTNLLSKILSTLHHQIKSQCFMSEVFRFVAAINQYLIKLFAIFKENLA